MNRAIALPLGLFLTLSAISCGPGPGGSPEETARNFAQVIIEDTPQEIERRLDRNEWELDCMEAELEWWADQGELRKEIDLGRSELEFRRDSLDQMTDEIQADVVNIEKHDDNNATVTMKIWAYQVVKGKGPKDFFLEYQSRKESLTLTKDDGDWKIKNNE